MHHNALQILASWKRAGHRVPLIVDGMRGVGKTTLVMAFAEHEFGTLARIDLAADEDARSAIEHGEDMATLLTLLGALTGTDLADAGTLLFLDNAHACPGVQGALERMTAAQPGLACVAAGSGLCSAWADGDGTDGTAARDRGRQAAHLTLHPLSFDEFVGAVANEQLAELLRGGDLELIDALSERYLDLLETYLYVGGMPAAVEAYREAGAEEDEPRTLAAARAVQEEILASVRGDVEHGARSELQARRAHELMEAAPAQLVRPGANRRFMFSAVAEGGRGRDYREALELVEGAGLVTRVPKVDAPTSPLTDHEQAPYFKLYLADVGLLGAATGLDAAVLAEDGRIFSECGGAYTEQYVCQQLVASDLCRPCYWAADGKHAKGTVDFIYEYEGMVYPVDVAERGGAATGGLKAFVERYGLAGALRLSPAPAEDKGWLVNLPLYAACLLP